MSLHSETRISNSKASPTLKRFIIPFTKGQYNLSKMHNWSLNHIQWLKKCIPTFIVCTRVGKTWINIYFYIWARTANQWAAIIQWHMIKKNWKFYWCLNKSRISICLLFPLLMKNIIHCKEGSSLRLQKQMSIWDWKELECRLEGSKEPQHNTI